MRLSFRLKTIIGVAIIEGSLLLFLVWSSIDYLQHSNEEELRTRAQTTAVILANLSRDSILSLDLAQLESFARQALDSPDAVYVRIKDADRTLTQVGDEYYLNKSFVEDNQLDLINDGVFDVAADLEHSGFHYGRVELGLSIDRATLLFQTAIRHLSIIAAIEMLLVALFSYVLGSYLTRGLSYLRDASAGIADGEIGLQVNVSGNDELAQTGKAFNSMSKRVAQTQSAMADKIRESKVLALRLSEQEMRLSTILNTVLDGFVVIDSEGLIDDINSVGTALFGYRSDELKGQNVSILLPTTYKGEHGEDLLQYLKTGRERIIGKGREVSGLRKDGTIFPMELSVTAMKLSGKRMFVGLVRDLTEKKNIEYEAKRNAAMKSALVSANLDALITFDINDRIVEFNAVAESMFRYSRDQIAKTPISALILTSELTSTHLKGVADLLTSGGCSIIGQRIEVEAKRASGERFPAEVAIQLIEVDGEKMFTAFIRDIYDRKEAEAALKAATLEAESASEAKSRFLAHMSHEIRSPLNAVLGSVGLLLDDGLKAEQQLYAKTAQTSAKALLGLINDVLDFSKIEAGLMQLDQSPFCLNKLLEDVADVVGFHARDKDVQTVIVKQPGTPEHYIGDKVRIRQILLNLMDNALKFTQHGAVVLSVSHSNEGRKGLRFTVADSGIGITKESAKVLFDEFQQVDNSDATQHGGTGLGLSISRALCEAMSGTMHLKSELGTGSQFTVDLPLKQTTIDSTNESAELHPMPLDGVVVGLHPLVKTAINSLFKQPNAGETHYINSSVEALPLITKNSAFLLAAGDLELDELIRLAAAASEHQVAHKILLAPINDEKLAKLINSEVYDFLLPIPLTLHRLQQIILDNSYTHNISVAKRSPGTATITDIGGHILLAEDSAANRIVASGILERAGYTLDTAEDGQKALDTLLTSHYDLVLMDVRMPVMDGLEATRKIRKQENASASATRLPIIAMTANTSDADRQRCLRAGMDDFVPKPVDTKQLLNVLSQNIRISGSGDMNTASQDKPLHEEANHTHPLLDVTIIEQLAEDTSPEALPKMLHLFIDEIITRSTRLQDDVVSHAWDNMENEAHTLKSCAGTFGALELQSIAKLIEAACRDKDPAAIEQQTAMLADVIKLTLSAYREQYSFLISSDG